MGVEQTYFTETDRQCCANCKHSKNELIANFSGKPQVFRFCKVKVPAWVNRYVQIPYVNAVAWSDGEECPLYERVSND